MELLSLHYRDSRRAEFKVMDDMIFNQELKSWFVFKPEVVVDLLRDDERLIVPDTVANIRMLETRYKRQFPHLIYAVSVIPLLLNGQVHREVRRGMAEMVLEGRARVLAAMPELMARHIVPLDRESTPEWIESRLSPLVSEVFGLICNCPEPLPFPKLVLTRLFDRFVSLAALGEAERQLGQLRQRLAGAVPEVEQAHVVGLLVLGRDSLLGSLGTSLHTVLRVNEGKRFADIEFPDFPPETGVAIAERVATADIRVGAHMIAAGDRVRMYFQPISDMNSTNNFSYTTTDNQSFYKPNTNNFPHTTTDNQSFYKPNTNNFSYTTTDNQSFHKPNTNNFSHTTTDNQSFHKPNTNNFPHTTTYYETY
ncbi:hypothetical protein [Aetokthonos hydrillicola]|uniref:hypothetical protein n=1 Tax=Aetokthonos hydrillicola TaxID=1550245 RepID=UPI002877F4AF|nr:hypothetical protein [Aetokthonos hydrillicola]